MSKDEIKLEINKVLDHFSDQTLADLLSFLKNIEGNKHISLINNSALERILIEDQDLLHKLAK